MIAEPATSLTSVLGGVSTLEAEAGFAIIGMAIAALPLSLLVFLRRRILVVFRGRATEAKVTRIETSATRTVKAHLVFRAVDGREIDVPQNMAPGVHVGDTVRIRYDPARPDLANYRTAGATTIRILLPLVAFAAVGLLGLVGTFWSVGTGTFNGFSSAYFVVLLLTFAAFAFLTAGIRFTGADPAEPSAGRRAAARNALAPTLLGLVLLAFGVYVAFVFFG